MIQYQSWETQEDHDNCLLPCIILERLRDEESDETTYTAKLVDHHHENESIEYACHIFRRFEYIYTDIPRRGIGTCFTIHIDATFKGRGSQRISLLLYFLLVLCRVHRQRLYH